MKYLFDTHTWLWLLIEPKRIGPKARALVRNTTNQFCLSIASAWEIAIKHAAGRPTLPEPPVYTKTRLAEDAVSLLPVRLD